MGHKLTSFSQTFSVLCLPLNHKYNFYILFIIFNFFVFIAGFTGINRRALVVLLWYKMPFMFTEHRNQMAACPVVFRKYKVDKTRLKTGKNTNRWSKGDQSWPLWHSKSHNQMPTCKAKVKKKCKTFWMFLWIQLHSGNTYGTQNKTFFLTSEIMCLLGKLWLIFANYYTRQIQTVKMLQPVRKVTDGKIEYKAHQIVKYAICWPTLRTEL